MSRDGLREVAREVSRWVSRGVSRAVSLSCTSWLALASVVAPAWAHAQDTQDTHAVQAAQTADAATAAWHAQYEQARAALVAERFSEAREQLQALVDTAPTVEDKRLATELAEVARGQAEQREQREHDQREQEQLERERLERAQHEHATSLANLTSPPPASARPSQPAQPTLRTNDELSVLYTAAALYGLGSGGWVTLQLKPQTFGGAILPFAIVTSAAVGGVALADGYRPLRHGVPHAIAGGLYLGFGEGMWVVAYQHAYATGHAGTTSWHAERVSTALWAGSTAGALLGGLVGAVRRPTPGRVSFTGSTAIWAGVLSAFAADAIDPDQHRRAQTSYLVGGIGYNVGLLGGIVLGPGVAPSVARVRFIDLGGLGGALLGAGGYELVANRPDSRGDTAAAAIGGAAGLALLWWATSGMPADHSHDALPSALGSLRTGVAPTRGGFMATLSGAL